MKNTRFYIAIFSSIMFFSCKEQKAPETQESEPIRVKVYIVQAEKYNFRINCSGRIVSDEEFKLSFKTAGVIGNIKIKEGQKVKKGQLLAKLNLSEIEAKVRQASLALDKATRDYKRVQNLYNDSVATLEQYQDVKTALGYAKSNLEIARFNLEYSVIKAPYDGTILKILAEENEIIGSGHPVILFGSNEKNWMVKTSVTDNQVVKINLGDKAKVYTDAYPDTFLTAKVFEVSQFADPYTGVFDVELQIDPINLKLVSGLIVKNEIITRSSVVVTKIPYIALLNADVKSAYVYKVVNGKPVKQPVKIFKLLDDYVLIKKGISQGEQVITENVNYLKNGDSIQIVE